MPRSSRLNKPGIHIGCSTFGFLVPSNLRQYAIVEHPTYGKVYAFEVALEAKGKINLINSL
ncbi:MAG: hypothetical protein ABFC30_06430 [Proteiniphilum sp.]